MFQQCAPWWSKRTPGYVFWRQSTLVELQNVKRSYLLSERPLPIAEVARRMVRVRTRYEATTDYRERVLLRGEYKYFSGKPVDVRACRVADLIALLQCGGFFGFWDASQANGVLVELLRRFDELSASEMCTLFVALPKLRKRDGELFARLATSLVNVVPQLTVDECLALCAVAEPDAAPLPDALLHNVLVAISSELDTLTPSQCVQTVDVLCAAPASVRTRFDALFHALRSSLTAQLDSLTPLDTAALYYNLTLSGVCESALEVQLLRHWVTQLPRTCARSVAMVFAALAATTSNDNTNSQTDTEIAKERMENAVPHERSGAQQPSMCAHRATASCTDAHVSPWPCTPSRVGLWLTVTRALAERVVFLATDFTPTELLSVLPVYLFSLAMMVVATAPPKAAKAGLTSLAASRDVSRMREAAARQLQLQTLQHVVRQLTEQLLVVLDNPAAYVSRAQLLELLRMYATMATELRAQTGTSSSSSSAAAAAKAGVTRNTSRGEVVHEAAHTNAVLRQLSAKLVAQIPTCSCTELVHVLQLVDALHGGGQMVEDALVTATVRELMRREVDVERGMAMADVLDTLQALRPLHLAHVSDVLVPKLRAACE